MMQDATFQGRAFCKATSFLGVGHHKSPHHLREMIYIAGALLPLAVVAMKLEDSKKKWITVRAIGLMEAGALFVLELFGHQGKPKGQGTPHNEESFASAFPHLFQAAAFKISIPGRGGRHGERRP